METPHGYILAAEGDDIIEIWSGPLSDMDQIDEILQYAREFHHEIDWSVIADAVPEFKRSIDALQYPWEACGVDLLDFHPDIDISSESWGGDCPGHSGVYLRVYVRKAKVSQIEKQVSRLAKAIEKYWSDSGGLDKVADELEQIAEKQAAKASEEARLEKERKEQRAAEHEDHRVQRREETVARVLEFYRHPENLFCYPSEGSSVLAVKEGPTFVMVKAPYKSEESLEDAGLIADALEANGVLVHRIDESSPEGCGHIPHFAGAKRAQVTGWHQTVSVLLGETDQVTMSAELARKKYVDEHRRVDRNG